MSVMPSFLNDNKENTWQKASASLDATARIYGYRVDLVHSETYKFLGGLNRTEFKEEIEEGDMKDILHDEECEKKNTKEREKMLVIQLF